MVSVIVSNLPEITAADQLRFAFSPVGRVIDAFIPASSRRGRGFCSGFVRFGNMETAVRAVKLMNGKRFAGRKLEVNVAKFGWARKDRREGTGGSVNKQSSCLSPKSKADLIPKWGNSSVLPSTIVDGRGN